MKILQLCLRVPFPPADGGTIAMYNLAMGLHHAGASVKVLAMNTKKHFVDPATLPSDYVQTYNLEMVYLDASVKVVPAVLNLFTNESYNISRFDLPLFHRELERILTHNKFDIIQFESLFVTPYINTIQKLSNAKLVLRAHNMEHVIWERLAASEKNYFKKLYLKFLAGRLKNYEVSVLNRFDSLLVLTQQDHDLFKKNGCVKTIQIAPIGIDVEKYNEYPFSYTSSSVFHLGSMDWLPNLEGVDWFVNEVLPGLLEQKSNIQIYLAGKSMPDRIRKLQSQNLHISGRVDDAKQFMSDKQIMIVPLLSGGGMRVKIIEGLAMGKTIISTTIGAEGINYTHNENIIIADTPDEFRNAIIKCISDPEYCSSIGRNAVKLAKETYNNTVIGNQVVDFYKSILGTT